MKAQLKNTKILVVNPLDSTRKMLINVLKLLGVVGVDEAYEATDAFRKFKEKNHDVVIASLSDGVTDAVTLAKSIRTDAGSPDAQTAVLAVTGPKSLHLVDAAREAGVTDLLQAPYTVDDISSRLSFILSLDAAALANENAPSEPKAIESQVAEQEDWPEEEETISLTDMLLDHYMKHHEIVLAKLQFAQGATKKSIAEIRNVHAKVKTKDNTNIHEFDDFEKMWEEVIGMFLEGGLGEEEIFEIEKLVTTVPDDIKKHYNDLSQQDKSFLALVEDLNSNAYKKAKGRVVKLQEQPNPLTGRTADDYKTQTEENIRAREAEEGDSDSGKKSAKAVFFHPYKRK